jgi:hypothetical protein
MTNEEKSREVAIVLKLWKEGEKCTWCSIHNYYSKDDFDGEYYHSDHDIPPPDLTTPEGADRLMTALIDGYRIRFHTAPDMIDRSRHDIRCVLISTSWGTEWRSDDYNNWREALLDAAYKLLCEDKNEK